MGNNVVSADCDVVARSTRLSAVGRSSQLTRMTLPEVLEESSHTMRRRARCRVKGYVSDPYFAVVRRWVVWSNRNNTRTMYFVHMMHLPTTYPYPPPAMHHVQHTVLSVCGVPFRGWDFFSTDYKLGNLVLTLSRGQTYPSGVSNLPHARVRLYAGTTP